MDTWVRVRYITLRQISMGNATTAAQRATGGQAHGYRLVQRKWMRLPDMLSLGWGIKPAVKGFNISPSTHQLFDHAKADVIYRGSSAAAAGKYFIYEKGNMGAFIALNDTVGAQIGIT